MTKYIANLSNRLIDVVWWIALKRERAYPVLLVLSVCVSVFCAQMSVVWQPSSVVCAQSIGGKSGIGGHSGVGGGSLYSVVAQCVALNTGTCTINSTGANLIIVDQITGGTATIGPAPTENKGNTFQTPTASKCAIGTGGVVQGYYIFNPTVGSGHIFTGGATSNVYFVLALAGALPTSGVFDVANCASQAGGTSTSFNTGSVTPSNPNEFIYTLAFDVDSNNVWTIPPFFSPGRTSTSYAVEETAYYRYPLSVAINPTWKNVTAQNFVGNTMAFTHQ